MIALALSCLFAAYLLIPNALFRLVLSRFVPLRVFQERKTEDLTRAVVTLSAVYIVSLLIVWRVPGCKTHPLYFQDSAWQRTSDYETVASGLYSEAMFRQYGPRYWPPLRRVIDRQGRLLCWYYLLVALAGLMAGVGCKHYGRWRKYKILSLIVLPHISQWYVLLTPFTFKDRRTVVKADVLMTDGNLYKGEVADHFLDKDGNLSGVFLGKPMRFDRVALMNERKAWGSNRPTSKLWTPIPSAKLYLVADKIVNLNLQYEPPTASPLSIEKYLETLRRQAPGFPAISVSVRQSASAGEDPEGLGKRARSRRRPSK